jgi:hypothetical protein
MMFRDAFGLKLELDRYQVMHVLAIECHAGCAYLPKVLKSVESTYICQKTHLRLSAHGPLSRTGVGRRRACCS